MYMCEISTRCERSIFQIGDGTIMGDANLIDRRGHMNPFSIEALLQSIYLFLNEEGSILDVCCRTTNTTICAYSQRPRL